MRTRAFGGLAFLIACLACSQQGDPRGIVEEFWLASKAGDLNRARSLVTEASREMIKEPDEEDSGVGDFTLGAVSYDGDAALVETTITAGEGEMMEIVFETVAVQEAGEWRVDLAQTTDRMTRAILGTTMTEVAEQMGRAVGEAMGKAMQGAAEGMVEGMEAMSDSMRAAQQRRR